MNKSGDRLARFIPALAGNTEGVLQRWSEKTVHPRARGEHGIDAPFPGEHTGSSPRSRGTHVQSDLGLVLRRFIPALAGNTMRSFARWKMSSVHPRARGEHRSYSKPLMMAPGSSPRSRGTRRLAHKGRCFHRFIPALAGNTLPGSVSWPSPPVHPRARGEHC